MPRPTTALSLAASVPGLAKAGTARARLSPARASGREVAATLLRQVLGEEGEQLSHVARVLGVSRALVRQWCDPAAEKPFAVGDLLALRIVGSRRVAIAYSGDVYRWAADAPAPGLTRFAHVVALARASADATAALSSGERDARVVALRRLRRCTDAALADEGAPPSSRANGA